MNNRPTTVIINDSVVNYSSLFFWNVSSNISNQIDIISYSPYDNWPTIILPTIELNKFPHSLSKSEMHRASMRSYISSIRPKDNIQLRPNCYSGSVSHDFAWMTHRYSSYHRCNPKRVRLST
ncbi:MAG TPA: hypothetical protein VIE65_11185 [Methylobacter sp.]|jgi:hypothetical protein